MSAKHTHAHTPSVRHMQTLSHASAVVALDMRMCSDKEKKLNCVVLICADCDGCISVHLSHTQRLNFTLRKRFHAHTAQINDLHFHRHKRLFVSASWDKAVKVWSFIDITTPTLIQCLPHPSWVCNAKYSQSGLLLTSCEDDVLRIYGKEPLFSLYWSFKTSGSVHSVAWSPSNRVCASFKSSDSNVVQVWDSSFRTIFKLQQNDIYLWDGLVFASNDLLMSSGGYANKVYWYHISKPKVMKVFVEQDVLPFCCDVLKIIIQYLPFDTRVTHEELRNRVGPVVALSSEVAGAQCWDDTLRLYKVDGNEPRLLASLPYECCDSLVTCVYPCSGKETGFMLASSHIGSKKVNISFITSQVWIM